MGPILANSVLCVTVLFATPPDDKGVSLMSFSVLRHHFITFSLGSLLHLSDSFGYSVNQHFSIRSQYALQDTKPSSKQELDSPHFQRKGVPLTSEVNINPASR